MLTESIGTFFSLWYVYLIYGLVFGSFLNVVIYRVPNGLSLLSPPSSCPNCGHRIKWYENIPVLSWIFLRGKCSGCKGPISVEYAVIELVTGLLTMGLFLFYGPDLRLLIFIPLSYTLLCILMIDFKTYSIPHGLNISILIIAAAGIILHLLTGSVLPVDITGSVLGAVTGFGILAVIQAAGRLIYKQAAMGTGDLFLLGSAGLILGPRLVFTAFVIAALTAVVSHSIPSIINSRNREKEALKFLKEAEKLPELQKITAAQTLEKEGLLMQLFYRLGDPQYRKTAENHLISLKDEDAAGRDRIRGYFRFRSVDRKEDALKLLEKIDPEAEELPADIRNTIHEDLLGYGFPSDNLELLISDCAKAGLNELGSFLRVNRKDILENSLPEDIGSIKEHLNNFENNKDKLDFLLKCNRFFQYNGYTAEQKNIIDLIEKEIDLSDSGVLQYYLSDIALVYYTDFFFKESLAARERLLRSVSEHGTSFEACRCFLNLSLFRIFFYRQRLAFGPFLAIGIMISLLYGEKLAGLYFGIIEGFIK